MFLMPFVANAIHPISRIGNITAGNTTVSGASVLGSALGSSTSPNDTTALFCALLFIIIIGSIFVGPLPAYVDTMSVNAVKTSDTGATYGIQRIFGSLGFSLASLLASVAVEHYHDKWLSKYTAVFILYFSCAIALIPFGYYVVSQTNWDDTDKSTTTTTTTDQENKSGMKMVKKIFRMCSKPEVLIVMVTVLISGLANNIFNSFAFKFAAEVFVQSKKTEISFIFVIATGAEVLLFPFTEKLIKILGGPTISMSLGIFSFFVRFLIMATTRSLPLMLTVQLLHAFGFALFWAALMEFLHVISPKDIMMSMFLIFQSIMFGVAALLANVVGGYLYERVGGGRMFAGTGVMCGVWSLIITVYYGFQYWNGRRSGGGAPNVGAEMGTDNQGGDCAK